MFDCLAAILLNVNTFFGSDRASKDSVAITILSVGMAIKNSKIFSGHINK
jgi:hypothetical protein